MRRGTHHTIESRAKISHSHTGKPLSEEHKRNISKAHKGRKHSEEWNRRVAMANRGKKRTGEQNRRTSEVLKKYYETHDAWNKGRPALPERVEKQRQSLLRYYETHDHPRKGQPLSEEQKAGISKRNREYFQAHPHPMQGKHHTQETKQKISKSRTGKGAGPEHYNWKGGRSFEPYPPKFNDALKKRIRERDNNTCQLCNMLEERSFKEWGQGLSVHHIDYDKKNLQPKNLITLCHRCNATTNFNRELWEFYFVGLQAMDYDMKGWAEKHEEEHCDHHRLLFS